LHHGLNEAALRKDREMKNPLDQFRSGLFGSRGCDIEAALQYVDELAAASSDAVAVQTAARVLLNTAANAVHQVMNAPSPERLALIELIDERIAASASNIDQQISDWMDSNVDHDHLISEWLSDNFDVTDYNINDAIHEWASDNQLKYKHWISRSSAT
jgi:hypothetical protein